MGWIVFEALLALFGMLALVWWTFRSRREDEAPPSDDESRH
jgi:hypothetical protein